MPEPNGSTSRYYTYDAAENRIKAIVDTATTIEYTYDSAGRLMSETASNGQTSTITTYTYNVQDLHISKEEMLLKIKKCLIGALLIISLFAGCIDMREWYKNDANHAGDVIVEALDKRDAELFKSVLSEKALASEDIDESIEYCFQLIEGKVASVEKYGMPEHTYYEAGKHSIRYSGAYRIYMDSGKDIFLDFEYFAIQPFDNTEVGLNNLKITIKCDSEAKDNSTYKSAFDYGRAGVYNPSWDDE